MILTRYLYEKTLVEASLRTAILIRRSYDEACFWAYELYFSGFEKEVLSLLIKIYVELFKENHPNLGIYIRKKSAELNGKPELIATVIKNLTMKSPSNKEAQGVKFVNVKPYHINPFMTKEPKGHCWKFLREVCLYGVLGNSSMEITGWRENWMVHAMGSPVWSKRMIEYGGYAKGSKIVFENPEREEEFWDKYDYEPDEQPAEIRVKCIGQ
jgi:hypothetical protein